MDNKRKIPDLQQETLKKQPFSVPDGYFESFSDRLQARIREEQQKATPVHRIRTFTRARAAMAAAILSVALISYSILRFAVFNQGPSDQADVALIDEFNLMEDDFYLVETMESTDEMNDEEAFASQAMDYLAINDVEMILLLE
jgi:hypothetical protein